MKHFRWLLLALLISGQSVFAASSINTIGSETGDAIGGFDAVGFWTEKKALPGKREHSFDWMGAKWLFASQSNADLFKSDPQKYAPQYGGHCTWGISENVISRKTFGGVFELMNDKLYLFAPGNRAPDGARTSFWQSGGGPGRRIPDAEKYWPSLKAKLEAP
jgi:YHS domain-containing protein